VGLTPKAPSDTKVPMLRDVVEAINASGRHARLYLPTSLRTLPDFTTDATVSELTSGSDSSESAMRNRNGFEITTPSFILPVVNWEAEVRVVLEHLQGHFTPHNCEPIHGAARACGMCWERFYEQAVLSCGKCAELPRSFSKVRAC
jgi:hypothetical protein